MSIRDNFPATSAGKVRFADSGTYDPALNATVTVLERGTGHMHGYPTVRLQHVTRGFYPAGAAMVWREERYSVLYDFDGAEHGKSFLPSDEPAARAYFAALMDADRVAARRASDAVRVASDAIASVEADKVTIEAAKTYRSSWQWRVAGEHRWNGFAKTKAAAIAQGKAAVYRDIRATMPYCA